MKLFMTCSLQDTETLLDVAAEKGHTDVVDILVKHGAYMDMDTKNRVNDL